jgi:hypothetical protein
VCQRRFALPRSIATCARSRGARLPHTTHVSVVGLRKTERRSPISAQIRKAVRKNYPVKNYFAQLTEKIKKLEKGLKMSGKKGTKHHYKDSNSDSE